MQPSAAAPRNWGPDTVVLRPDVYTISGGSNEDANVNGDLDITAGSNVTIVHTGITPAEIRGGLERILDVRVGGIATVSGLTLANASSNTNGGAVRNQEPSTSRIRRWTNNSATSSGARSQTSTEANSTTHQRETISGNRANTDSGGLDNFNPATTATLTDNGKNALLIVHVDEVDAHYERVRAAADTDVDPPKDQPYGPRTFTITDPSGVSGVSGKARRSTRAGRLTSPGFG